MAFSLVNHVAAGSSNNSDVTTGSIDTTGANRIVVGASWYTGVGAGGVITDSKSNTYTTIGTFLSNGANYTAIFECKNPTVGTGHTFSGAGFGSSSFPAIAVTAWSGNDTTSTADQHAEGAGGSSLSSTQPGSITPSVNNELVIAVCGSEATGTISVDSSMTISDQVAFVNTINFGICMAYIVQTTAGAINPTFSWSSGAVPANANIASFKSGAAGATKITMAGPTSPPLVVMVNTPAVFTFGVDQTPITGTVVVTPASNKAGTWSPTTVSLTTGSPSATATFTPSATSIHTISETNNGSLTDAATIAMDVEVQTPYNIPPQLWPTVAQ